MAVSNLERVGKGLELLNKGLQPFVERELKAAYRDRWIIEIEPSLHETQRPPAKGKAPAVPWDTQALPAVMWDHWNAVFKNTLGQAERTLVSELREVRNRWAHQKAFTTDDAYRALDSMVRLLSAVSAPDQAEAIDRIRQEVLRQRYEEQVRRETRQIAEAPIEGRPLAGLKPWREIVQPHPDVAGGRYLQAEFMADLWQVHCGTAGDEYKDPAEFFRRTYVTEGLRTLIAGALRRVNGQAGEPVVDLQTNFGGGKTHSMLALYHLFSGTPPGQLPGLEEIIRETGVTTPPRVRRAVLVGTKIPAGQPLRKPDGTQVRTLWGELAWQLGGRQAYDLIRSADETGTSPGDELRRVLDGDSPCLILIDEWVAYARQLYGHGRELPGGSLEAQFTFAQALTELVKSSPKALLVASLPVSEIEVGGEGGKVALAELRRILHRVEAAWRPAGMEESFEIVRRRLFQPIADPQLFVARDAVVRAFADLYRNQAQEFPNECREGDYERRLKGAYPIHPELFERLYQDWGSLEEFQLTRGVLRLLAAVIHTLWEREDRSLLILPAQVPLDTTAVENELMRYLADPWRAVIERDVDGPASLPLKLDRDNPNLGRYSACRRVARTVFLGSAPTHGTARRGLEDRRIRLGCVQPGEQVGVFGDALRRLAEQATHLYTEAGRCWFSTQPTVNRVAEDRAAQYGRALDKVYAEIEKQIRDQLKTRQRGELAGVHAFPATSGDVPDEMEARLVMLGPEHPHEAKQKASAALTVAARILQERGTAPRIYANTLVFLAADKSRLPDLEKAVCYCLAWQSILDDKVALNLDEHQKQHSERQLEESKKTVSVRIPETFCWLLVPSQSDPQSQDTEWQEIRLAGAEPLVERASKRLSRDQLLVTTLGGVNLKMELDRIPLWRGDHVLLKQLAEDFARYLYLPRLRDGQVLVRAVEDGVGLLTWRQDSFGYASAFDSTAGRYRGLQAGVRSAVNLDAQAVVVKPEVAARQLEAEAPPVRTPPGVTPVPPRPGAGPTPPPPPEPAKLPTRFHGSVKLDATRLSRDAGKIAEEVVQHLTSQVGAQVEVTLEIAARVPAGVPESVVRTVLENCRALRFNNPSFESE
jgi:predicted AAA+ superfamily ATPase